MTVKVLPGSHLVIMLGLRQWRFINGQLLLLVDPVLWRSISTPMDNRSFDLLRHVYGTGYIRLDLKGLVVANGAVETGNGDFPKQTGLVLCLNMGPNRQKIPKAILDDLMKCGWNLNYRRELE